MSQPLLTIAIPTYNRMALLDVCLSQLAPQLRAHGSEVELLVSDNCSTDDTEKLVAGYLAAGTPLRYLRNETNIGADRNFVQCFSLASGRFVWLLSDDDLLLEGGLERVLKLLQEENPGVLHIRSYSFQEDFRKERPRKNPSGKVLVFRDPKAFAAKVHVNLTFISGSIVNKALVGADLHPEDFLDTNLVQLSWTLSAALHAETNLHLDEFIVAAKAENTGGYRLCTVFGVNMNRIFRALETLGGDPAFFRVINRKTITTFFPAWILKIRSTSNQFHAEDAFETLRPVFRGFPTLWTMVWPVATLPVPVAKVWFKLCREWLKLTGRW